MAEQRTSQKDIELITTRPIQLIRSTGDKEYFSGYAVVWHNPDDPGSIYKMPHGVLERVDRNAFDDLFQRNAEMKLVYQHDGSHHVGDTETGTAHFVRDEIGIKVTAEYDPEDPVHQNIRAKIRKGMVRGMSFQGHGKSKMYRDQSGQAISIVTKVDQIEDFSFVHKPAYKATTANLIRSELDQIDQAKQIKQDLKKLLDRASIYLEPKGK